MSGQRRRAWAPRERTIRSSLAARCRCCRASIPKLRHDLGLAGLELLRPLWPAAGEPGRLVALRCLGLALRTSARTRGRLRQERRLSGCARRARIQPHRVGHRDAATAAGQSEAAHVPRPGERRAGQPHGIQQQGRGSPGLALAAQRATAASAASASARTPPRRSRTPSDDYLIVLAQGVPARRLHRHERVLAEHGAAARAAGERRAGENSGRAAAERVELGGAHGKRVPLLVKVAPNLEPDQVRLWRRLCARSASTESSPRIPRPTCGSRAPTGRRNQRGRI